MKRTWIVLITLMSLLTIPREAHAQQIFYDGDIVIDSIRADVVIGDEAGVFIEYLLINEGDEEETVSLAYPSVPVQLRSGDQMAEDPLVLGRESHEASHTMVVFNPDQRATNRVACLDNRAAYIRFVRPMAEAE